MTKYKTLLSQRRYADVIVEADNIHQAIMKVNEGEYDDVTESEFLLPSSDWEVETIEEIESEEETTEEEVQDNED